MGEEVLELRKQKVLEYFRGKPLLLISLVLAFLAGFGFYVRTRSLPLLIDVATGKYIPSDPDAMGILRYVQYVVEHGQLMTIDYMRYYPTGFSNIEEFSVMAHLVVWFYKIFHFFVSSVTVEYAHVVYPAFAFVVGLVFFYLFVQKVFGWKVALLASAFLTVVPAYLFRTLAGVSDKEALAMIFFFMGLYFFLLFFHEKKLWKAVVYSILSGIGVGALWCIWGGVVFVLTTIGTFVFVLVLLEKLSERNLWLYALFLFVTVAFLRIFFTIRASPMGLLTAPTSGILFFALALGIVHYYVYTKDLVRGKKYFLKFPFLPTVLTFGLLVVVVVLSLFLLYDSSFFTDRIQNLYIDLIEPFGRNRWALTVAESHQPYFTDWVSQFSLRYLVIVFFGAVLLFYEAFKSLGKKVYSLTVVYAVFLLAIALNRYSSSASVFNGETPLSIMVYLGGILFFLCYLGYFFYHLYTKDRGTYDSFLVHFPYGYIFVSLFFVFLLIGARSAVRLLFVFAPGTAILAAFFVCMLFVYLQRVDTKVFRYGAWIVLVLFVVVLLNAFSQSVLAQARSAGPSYTQQWQYGMDWVQKNTPEDAVFAHWWDYGYFVQTGGNRATLSDGGNAHPAINHFIGRHLLTGQNDTEALEILAAKNATHVVVVSDEIGKYGAFSAIGADANYDRYSWISAFTLDPSQSTQANNITTLVYTGGSVLDDSFVSQGFEFPAYAAAVVGFLIPLNVDENGNFVSFENPSAVVFYGSEYYSMPLRCVFLNGQENIFYGEEESFDGLDACFQIIPVYQNGNFNALGAGLYLSHEVWGTWFTEHYLFGLDSEYFTTVYSDEGSIPLAIYNGRIIGPLKIWDVSYPENLTIPEEYYGTELPEGVNTVREDLQ